MNDEIPRAEIDVRRHVAEVWRSWVDPRRLTDWFGTADAPLDRAGNRLRIEFGDGDFFAAEVTAVEAPYRLRLRWRFLGIGPVDEIAVNIASVPGGTVVTVKDSGFYGPDAEELLADWRDFLSRLKRYCETAEYSRYGWSPEIVFGFDLPAGGTAPALDHIASAVVDLARHRGQGAILHLGESTETTLSATVEHAGLAERTSVRLSVGGTRFVVEHTGWDTLPVASVDQVALRRVWLEFWLTVIHERGLAA